MTRTASPSSSAPVYRMAHGAYTAEIASLGGGIKVLTYNGEPLVETYEGLPPMCAGVVLAPWPNRTEDGRFTWRGTKHSVPVNEPERNNANHGFVLDAAWDLVYYATDRVQLTTRIEEPWPWPTQLIATYVLDAAGLSARFEASAEGPAPFAFGLHTYLSARGAAADASELTLPVTEHHLLDARNLPTGEIEGVVVKRQRIAEVEWDDCFHGHGPLTAEYVSAGKGVRLEMGQGLDWVQLYTPADYPGRGRALAVEPMSAPPNALRSGTDVAVLNAHQPIAYELRLSAI